MDTNTALATVLARETADIIGTDFLERIAGLERAYEASDRTFDHDVEAKRLRRQQTENARLFRVMAEDYARIFADTKDPVFRTDARTLHGYAVSIWKAAQARIDFVSDFHRLMVRGHCMHAAYGIPHLAHEIIEDAREDASAA